MREKIESFKKVYKGAFKGKVTLTTASLVAILLSSFAYGEENEMSTLRFNPFPTFITNFRDTIKEKNFNKIESFLGLTALGHKMEITGDEINAGIGGFLIGHDIKLDVSNINAGYGVGNLGNHNSIISNQINGALGITSIGSSNLIDAGKINAALGVVTVGNKNKVEIDKLNAVLGIASIGDLNSLTINNYFNGVAGIISGGNWNTITNNGTFAGVLGIGSIGDNNSIISNKIDGALGILSFGNNNSISGNKFNGAVGIGSFGDNNTISVNDYFNGALGILNIGHGNIIKNNGTFAGAVGIGSIGHGNEIYSHRTDGALGILSSGNNNTLTLDKFNGGVAIVSSGDNNNITSKDINGVFGILSQGSDNKITSTGAILGGIGISSEGTGNTVTNIGKIIAIGAGSLAGKAIIVEGDNNKIYNNGMVISAKLFSPTVSVVKVEGDNNTLENNFILLGTTLAGIDLKNKKINFGDSIGLDSIGSNSTIKNNSTGVIIATGTKGIGINSLGNNGSITNSGTIIGVDLNNFDFSGILTNPDLMTTILPELLKIAGSGTAIHNKGDNKEISNSGIIITETGIASEGDNNSIKHSGLLGSISANFGINSVGNDNTIESSATISAEEVGIGSNGDNNIIINSSAAIGSIGGLRGDTAILSVGSNNQIKNSGSVISQDIAIKTEGNENLIENSSTIKGQENAIKIIGNNNKIKHSGLLGSISGDIAIKTEGNENLIENSSAIKGQTNAIKIIGDNNSLKNINQNFSKTIVAGKISSKNGTAIDVEGNSFTLLNSGRGYEKGIKTQSGIIEGKQGINIVGDNANIINSGTFAGKENNGNKDIGIIKATGDNTTSINIVGTDSKITNNTNGIIEANGSNSTAISTTGSLNLVNGGEIKGSNIGIFAESLDLKNSGTISGNTHGINTKGDSTLTNSGTIQSNGENSIAILLNSSDNIVTNEAGGKILANGNNSTAISSSGTLNLVNAGEIKGSNIGVLAESLDLKNSGTISGNTHGINTKGDSTLTNSGTIQSNGENSIAILLNSSDNTVTNEAGGKILANGNNSTVISSSGTLNLTNAGEIKASNIAISSLGTLELNNSGTISGDAQALYVSGDNSSLLNGLTGVISGTQYALNLKGNGMEVINEGTISTTGINAIAINVIGDNHAVSNEGTIETTGDNSIALNLQGDNFFKVITNTNVGTISATGNNVVGVKLSGQTSFINHGSIEISKGTTDTNGIGILAQHGASAVNSGIVSVNTQMDFSTTDLNNQSLAMRAEGTGSSVTNSGTIQLNQILKSDIIDGLTNDNKRIDLLKNHLISGINGGTVLNNGVLKDREGEIIAAGGNHITTVYYGSVEEVSSPTVRYEIENMDKEESVHTDLTVAISGTTLNGVLNANEKFNSNDYLLNVENSITNQDGLHINGILNASKYGVNIADGSKVILNGTINASEIGVNLNDDSSVDLMGEINSDVVFAGNKGKLIGDGGVVTGNIVSSSGASNSLLSLINKSTINGNIDFSASKAGLDTIEILSESSVEGNISLGNVDSKITFNQGILRGNIVGGEGATTLAILNNSEIGGNITLGSGADRVSIDASSAGKFGTTSIIDGGTGQNILDLGTENETTVFQGTIQNFDTNTYGTLYLSAGANIYGYDFSRLTSSKGNIDIKDGNFVLGIASEGNGYNHALTTVSGNTISGDGTLYADTRDLTIGKETVVVALQGTKLNLASDQIKATQWLYDVKYDEIQDALLIQVADSGSESDPGTTPDSGSGSNPGTDTTPDSGNDSNSTPNPGFESQYSDIWNSIFLTGQAGTPGSTTTVGTKADYEKLMYQAKYRNIYSLGNQLAYDSMKAFELGIDRFIAQPEANRWIVQAEGIGYYGNNNYKNGKFHTAGAVVAGEYGINAKSSLGLAFGGGKQEGKFRNYSGKLDSDTFYFGIYGKTDLNSFKLTGGLGYQHNRFKAKNEYNNGLDSLKNDTHFDGNGFNLYGKGTYIYELKQDLTLEPNFGIVYNYLKQDSADEGNGKWAISVDSHSSNIVDFNFGLDLINRFNFKDGHGQTKLLVAHKISAGDLDKNLTGHFNGESTADYTIDGYNLATNTTTAGITFNGERSNGLLFGASYGFEFGSHAKRHKITLNAGYKF